MKKDYRKITQDKFDELLVKILNEAPAAHLLSIPGIYEILAEEYNNEILTRYEEGE